MLPRPHTGFGHHRNYHGGGRSWSGHHRGGARLGFGLGAGSIALGIGYGNWRYGGWNNWRNGWWNVRPTWYVESDWDSLSNPRKLKIINGQIATLKEELKESDNPETENQLKYLQRRRDQLARRL